MDDATPKSQLNQARKEAMRGLVNWMDLHVKYQIQHTLQKEKRKREPTKDAPKKARAKLDAKCRGNLETVTACVASAQATKRVRHNGKLHPVCDACYKAIRLYRKK